MSQLSRLVFIVYFFFCLAAGQTANAQKKAAAAPAAPAPADKNPCEKVTPPSLIGSLTDGETHLHGCADTKVGESAVANVKIGVILVGVPIVGGCAKADLGPSPVAAILTPSTGEFTADLTRELRAGEHVCIQEFDETGEKILNTSNVLPVAAPSVDVGAFQLLTGVGAVLAGARYTSYNTDKDVLEAANIGRKTPEILLGGAFILPWKKEVTGSKQTTVGPTQIVIPRIRTIVRGKHS